jgi:hypothetical protein
MCHTAANASQQSKVPDFVMCSYNNGGSECHVQVCDVHRAS